MERDGRRGARFRHTRRALGFFDRLLRATCVVARRAHRRERTAEHRDEFRVGDFARDRDRLRERHFGGVDVTRFVFERAEITERDAFVSSVSRRAMRRERRFVHRARAFEIAHLLHDDSEIDAHHRSGRGVARANQHVDRGDERALRGIEIAFAEIERREPAQDDGFARRASPASRKSAADASKRSRASAIAPCVRRANASHASARAASVAVFAPRALRA